MGAEKEERERQRVVDVKKKKIAVNILHDIHSERRVSMFCLIVNTRTVLRC